jgi:N-dimethylarginine dimethylaminohydrolase
MEMEKSFGDADYYEEVYEKWHPKLKTRFEDEVEKYWGRCWGANTEIGRLRTVLLHKPGEAINSIKPPFEAWRYTEKPNLKEMIEDHERLVQAFKDEGVEVVIRKPETYKPPRLVKSIYCRDPSFSCKGGMIVGRMYDALRRGEEVFTAQTYLEIGCPVLGIVHGAGIVEGGSVMWLDETHLAITTGRRTNDEGVRQVTEIVKTTQPEVKVITVPTYEAHEPLYMVDKHTALLNLWIQPLPYWFIEYLENELNMRLIRLPRGVEGACVTIEPGKVMIASDPDSNELRKILEKEKIEVIEVEIPSLVLPRNSGTIHCLTQNIIRDPEPPR